MIDTRSIVDDSLREVALSPDYPSNLVKQSGLRVQQFTLPSDACLKLFLRTLLPSINASKYNGNAPSGYERAENEKGDSLQECLTGNHWALSSSKE